MSGSIDISQLTPATSSSPSDLLPATQGSIGPATGTTRSVTPIQLMNQTQTISSTLAPAMASLTRTGSTTNADFPVLKTQWTINDTAGAGHNQTHNKTIVTSTPGELWCNYDEMTYTGPASTAGAGIVTRYIQATSSVNRDPSVLLWALITAIVDGTNQPASVSGGMLVQELDMEASGLANGSGSAGARRGLVIVGSKGRTYGGTDTEFNTGISVFSDTNTRFKQHINLDGKFNNAQILCHGTSEGGAPHLAIITGGFLSLDYPDNRVMLNANISGSDGVLTSNAPVRLPGFTVAALPALGTGYGGTIAYANNGRNAGEGGGAGTGCQVYYTSANAWFACWSGLAVTA